MAAKTAKKRKPEKSRKRFNYSSLRWEDTGGNPVAVEKKRVSDEKLLRIYMRCVEKGHSIEEVVKSLPQLKLSTIRQRISGIRKSMRNEGFEVPTLKRRKRASGKKHGTDFKALAKKLNLPRYTSKR